MNLFLAQAEAAEASTTGNDVSSKAADGLTELLEMIKTGDIPGLLDKLYVFLLKVGPKIVFAVIFLFVGFMIAGFVGKIARKAFQQIF